MPTEYTQIPPANLWGSVKQYYERGGFVNGLNPSIIGRIWYVNGLGAADVVRGSDTNTGRSPSSAFATMGRAFALIDSHDIIVLSGVIKEQLTAPLGVYDVTIIGAANRPRQSTDGGVATGGGASWLKPASPTATTPLLELRNQAWKLINFQMAAHTDDACVKMNRQESATYPDASHLSMYGMRFTGGLIGLEDYGGASNVLIDDCSFEDLAGAGGGAIVVTNQSIAIPSRWTIRNSRILPCVNGIVGAWVDSIIRDNTIAKSTTATMNLASGNTGLRNFVIWNSFNIAAADFDPAGGVTGNATDVWISYLTDTLEYGQPAN